MWCIIKEQKNTPRRVNGKRKRSLTLPPFTCFLLTRKIIIMASENVRAAIISLGVGEKVTFPMHRYEYVLSCRNKLQTIYGRKFASKKLSETNQIAIIRKS